MADESPKIEPVLVLKDSPSIAASDQAPIAEAAKPEIPETAPKIEAAEAKIEPKLELKIEKIEPKIEAPALPPAAQIAEPPTAIIPFKRPEPKSDAPAPQARTARFALLAASVAIAASVGAIGGSLGGAQLGVQGFAAPPP